jgi:hypothetical protein
MQLRGQNETMTRQRLVLIGLTIWALAMIVPELARIVVPLSSLGFFSDSNGLIYDASGPFDDEASSPAWQAGVRAGDRLDLKKMRCFPYDKDTCASTMAAVGGNLQLTQGVSATLQLAATADKPEREVTVTAVPRPSNWLVRTITALDQIAGIAVVLAAAWLVWTRPGPMSWGFFLYVVWFNPGQGFELYAVLQHQPLLLLLQQFLGCIAQGAGYAGLLLFVVRAPNDKVQPEWARFEKSLPYLAAAIAFASMTAFGANFGFKTEYLTRASIFIGFLVSIGAVTILMLRRRSLTPKDNQRLRWVLWGCLIGLPAAVIADLSQNTTLFASSWSGIDIPEDVAGTLYLINGILTLFVFEAIRRQRVINVAIPLRRATVLALMMSLPALLLHQQAEHLHELVELPSWAWLAIGAIILFVISRLHEWSVELTNGYFNRSLDKAEVDLGESILEAKTAAEIDQLLSTGVLSALKLSSATTFRRTDTGFHRYEDSTGWDGSAVRDLRLGDKDLGNLLKGVPGSLCNAAAKDAGFPSGLDLPVLAIPAASRVHCYAVTLYGPHESGTAIDSNEREMLQTLGRHAADAYARLENEELRKTIAELKGQAALRGALA